MIEDIEIEKRAFLESLKVTPEEQIEIMYEDQRTQKWINTRKGRLTASLFCAAAGHSKYSSIATLLKNMLWTKQFSNRATRRGNNLEPHVFELAQCHFEKAFRDKLDGDESEHDNQIWMEEVGLCIDAQNPYLAASTDGILHVGKRKYTIEIKAPNGKTADDIIPDYYDQVQGQMACLDIKESWFIVYQNDHIHVRYYPFDENYWYNQLLPALEYFYHELFLWRFILQKKGLIKEGEIDPIMQVKRPLLTIDYDKPFGSDSDEDEDAKSTFPDNKRQRVEF